MEKLNLSKTPKSFWLSDNYTGKAPLQKTEVTAFCDNFGMNFCFNVYETHICSFGTKYNDELWKGDIVEILLTLGSDDFYLEIEVNPNGLEYAVLIKNKDMKGDIDITKLDKSPFLSKTRLTDYGWMTDIYLPFDAIKKLGWQSNNSKINLLRQDFCHDSKLNLYALSATKCGKFHIPTAFIPLKEAVSP